MSDAAIRVEGLGKRFRIGAQDEGYRTLRDVGISSQGGGSQNSKTVFPQRAKTAA
jgi:hypothetical protein